MVLALYTLALAALFGVYFLSKRLFGEKPEYVELASEGELETIKKSSLEFEPMSNRLLQTESGSFLDPSRYYVYHVVGDSMKPVGINDHDCIVIKKIGPSFSLNPKDDLKTDDTVLIRLEESNEESKKYKIRKIADLSSNTVNVYYYRNGKKVYSSKAYNVSQIRGVVQYKILRKTPHKG